MDQALMALLPHFLLPIKEPHKLLREEK